MPRRDKPPLCDHGAVIYHMIHVCGVWTLWYKRCCDQSCHDVIMILPIHTAQFDMFWCGEKCNANQYNPGLMILTSTMFFIGYHPTVEQNTCSKPPTLLYWWHTHLYHFIAHCDLRHFRWRTRCKTPSCHLIGRKERARQKERHHIQEAFELVIVQAKNPRIQAVFQS